MTNDGTAIGIDFGGTSVKIGVVRGAEVVDHAPPIATQDFDGPEPLLVAICRTVEDLRIHHPGILAIGVGMPGFVDFEQGVVRNLTNVPGWHEFPLKTRLSQGTGLPVIVDNDANCMAYAEWKLGAGRGMQHLVAITLGTGVGGGLVVNNQMVRGARFGAGELGQMSIDWKGLRGTYGNLGALEEYIGNQEITQAASDAYHSRGDHRSLGDCTPAQLSRAAEEGDPVALELWNTIAGQLANVLMDCCWLLNPEALIIGGGVAKAGPLLFGPLQEALFSQLSDPFKEALQVLPARFGNEAGMIGAATQALESVAP
ncbi:glucokinase [Haloferula luteola]|uniref:Glucokinase n=1 Tax=Haloferula luteola TaxID=595692 RepID=A0A840VKD5_9BACT|nr:ROK family protein [Haloferula luteola]MBB5353131.1 glucokinase [Haloferula luteola]